MPNVKKRKLEAECKSQFNRTIKKTGKWRGDKASDYKKYKKVKKHKEPDFFLSLETGYTPKKKTKK